MMAISCERSVPAVGTTEELDAVPERLERALPVPAKHRVLAVVDPLERVLAPAHLDAEGRRDARACHRAWRLAGKLDVDRRKADRLVERVRVGDVRPEVFRGRLERPRPAEHALRLVSRGALVAQSNPGLPRLARRALGARLGRWLALAHGNELVVQGARRRVALGRLLREAALDDALDLRRDGGELREGGRLLDDDRVEELRLLALVERPTPGQHLVQHHADAPHVRRGPDVARTDLLRRHVGRRARHRRRLVNRSVVASEAEVEHARAIVLVDHHVARLEVAVNDSLVMRGGYGLGGLARDAHGVSRLELAITQEHREVGPLDELHRVVGAAVERRAHVEDGDDPRIVHTRRELRLGPHRCVVGVTLGLHLQRDATVEPRLDRLPDDAHAAPTEHAYTLVAGDLGRRCAVGGRHRPLTNRRRVVLQHTHHDTLSRYA